MRGRFNGFADWILYAKQAVTQTLALQRPKVFLITRTTRKI